MKVLWLTNIPLPCFGKELSLPIYPYGGWMEGLHDYLSRQSEIAMIMCFPSGGKMRNGICSVGQYYTFGYSRFISKRYIASLSEYFLDILQKEEPDIIHMFGTEYLHAYAMTQAARQAGKLNRVLLNIQGLCGPSAQHYCDLLPFSVVYGVTPYDVLKRSCIAQQRNSFQKLAVYEKEILASISHVVGRTDWDLACTMQYNPAIRYHFCNEILRPCFYEPSGRWQIEQCERHTLLMGQGGYPIKGLHVALEGFSSVVQRYPDAVLYIPGNALRPIRSIFDRFVRTAYERYIARLLRKHRLEKHVRFLGQLGDTEIKDRLRRAHVLLLSSFAENESNIVSEARMVGTPVVASFVGGLPNRIRHGADGFCYPSNAPYMLAYYIQQIFQDDNLATTFSTAGYQSASGMLDAVKNGQRMVCVYKEVFASSKA